MRGLPVLLFSIFRVFTHIKVVQTYGKIIYAHAHLPTLVSKYVCKTYSPVSVNSISLLSEGYIADR